MSRGKSSDETLIEMDRTGGKCLQHTFTMFKNIPTYGQFCFFQKLATTSVCHLSYTNGLLRVNVQTVLFDVSEFNKTLHHFIVFVCVY